MKEAGEGSMGERVKEKERDKWREERREIWMNRGKEARNGRWIEEGRREVGICEWMEEMRKGNYGGRGERGRKRFPMSALLVSKWAVFLFGEISKECLHIMYMLAQDVQVTHMFIYIYIHIGKNNWSACNTKKRPILATKKEVSLEMGSQVDKGKEFIWICSRIYIYIKYIWFASRRYPAKTITDANYTDDIAILANSPDQAETLLHSLERTAAGIGL